MLIVVTRKGGYWYCHFLLDVIYERPFVVKKRIFLLLSSHPISRRSIETTIEKSAIRGKIIKLKKSPIFQNNAFNSSLVTIYCQLPRLIQWQTTILDKLAKFLFKDNILSYICKWVSLLLIKLSKTSGITLSWEVSVSSDYISNVWLGNPSDPVVCRWIYIAHNYYF